MKLLLQVTRACWPSTSTSNWMLGWRGLLAEHWSLLLQGHVILFLLLLLKLKFKMNLVCSFSLNWIKGVMALWSSCFSSSIQCQCLLRMVVLKVEPLLITWSSCYELNFLFQFFNANACCFLCWLLEFLVPFVTYDLLRIHVQCTRPWICLIISSPMDEETTLTLPAFHILCWSSWKVGS